MKNIITILALVSVSSSVFALNLDCSVYVTSTKSRTLIGNARQRISTDFLEVVKTETLKIGNDISLAINLRKVCAADGGPCVGSDLSMNLQAEDSVSSASGFEMRAPMQLQLKTENLNVVASCRQAVGE